MFMNFESSFTFFFPIGVIFLFLFLIFISNFLKMVEFKSLMKEIIFHFFMIIYPSMWLMIILFFLIMMMNVFSLVPSVFSLSSLPLMTLSMSFLMWLSGYLYSIITKYNNCVSHFLPRSSPMILFFFLLTWLVLSLSELNRTPFDLVEGESELVSGFNVEYSSFGFTLLFLSEYMNIWFMSILFMLLYNSSLTFMCFSVIFYVLLNLFIRGLLPRYKFIQLINLMWKVFLPFVFIILLFFMVNIFL